MRPALWLSLLVLSLAAIGVAAILILCSGRGEPSSAATPDSDGRRPITCLGRIEPEDGVRRVAAPSFAGRPSIVTELLVEEGDSVRTGQVIGILESRGRLEAAWNQARAAAEVARQRLALVRAGAKAGDIAAQRAEIARLESELADARTQHRRNETLYRDGILSDSEVERSRLRVDTAAQALARATETLSSLAEVRPIDVDLARADVQAAEAAAKNARAEMDLATIRSPIDGMVVKVHARPGEEVGHEGVVELAVTERMYVTAEVYETDLDRLRVGQRATVTGDSFPGELRGTVERVGFEIGESLVLPADPAVYSDVRVAEARIRLDDAGAAPERIHARVTVVIQP